MPRSSTVSLPASCKLALAGDNCLPQHLHLRANQRLTVFVEHRTGDGRVLPEGHADVAKTLISRQVDRLRGTAGTGSSKRAAVVPGARHVERVAPGRQFTKEKATLGVGQHFGGHVTAEAERDERARHGLFRARVDRLSKNQAGACFERLVRLSVRHNASIDDTDFGALNHDLLRSQSGGREYARRAGQSRGP